MSAYILLMKKFKNSLYGIHRPFPQPDPGSLQPPCHVTTIIRPKYTHLHKICASGK